MNVTYPEPLYKYGFLSLFQQQMFFTPLDRKYDHMLVRDIIPEVYDKIKDN